MLHAGVLHIRLTHVGLGQFGVIAIECCTFGYALECFALERYTQEWYTSG